ncbi:MAG: hypothetical protein M3O65_10820 [Actinomycetota bacterium]|nr:hypothetical protein [Actinomycetota bacterium]
MTAPGAVAPSAQVDRAWYRHPAVTVAGVALGLGALALLVVSQIVGGPSEYASVVLVSTPGRAGGLMEVTGSGWDGDDKVLVSWRDGSGGNDYEAEEWRSTGTTRFVQASAQVVDGRFAYSKQATCCYPKGTYEVVVKGYQSGQVVRRTFEFWQ